MNGSKNISNIKNENPNIVTGAMDLSLKIKCESNSLPEFVAVDNIVSMPNNTGNTENKSDSIIETLKMEVTCEEEETQETKKNIFYHEREKNLIACDYKMTDLEGDSLMDINTRKPKYNWNFSNDDDTPLSQYLLRKNVDSFSIIEKNIKKEIVSIDKVTKLVGNYEVGKKKNMTLLSKNERTKKRRFNKERQLAKAIRVKKMTDKMEKKNPYIKKKVYMYKKGKKVFCKSDSESSDFEKYVYFDESKTKRKVKLFPNISLEQIKKEILDIKIENICLMKEHARINQLKLRERLQLRLEIKRLKAVFMDLKLKEYLKNQLTPQVGTTAGLIDVLKMHLDTVDYSKIALQRKEELNQKFNTISFTDSDFWENFNSIETSTNGISSIPFWVGDLDVITPNVKKYYKPHLDLNTTDLNNDLFDVENYPFTGSSWNVKTSEIYDVKTIHCESPKIDSGNDYMSEFHDEDTHYSESEIYNPDWNSIATKNRNNDRKLKNDKGLNHEIFHEINNTKYNGVTGVHSSTKVEERRVDDVLCDQQNEHTFTDSSNPSDGELFTSVLSDKSESDKKQTAIAEIDEVTMAVEEVGICAECGFDSSWSSFIARHRDAYQKSIKITPCHSCNMKFLKSGHFDGRHRLKRPPPKKFRSRLFICDTCGQGCTSRSGLAQHNLKHKEARYPCPHCPYRCRRKAYIKIHIATHSKTLLKQINYETNVVNQETITTQDQLQNATSILVVSSDTSTDKEQLTKPVHSCDECGHVSLNEKSLNKHKSLIHGLKVYTCDQCNYSAKKAGTLTQHLKTHSKEKPFQCAHCDYRSSCKSYLKSHERYHTGVKPFQCDICDYSCVTSTRMKVHQRKHTGERPHCCTECDYKCSTGHSLRIHMKIHSIGSKTDSHVDYLQNVERIS